MRELKFRAWDGKTMKKLDCLAIDKGWWSEGVGCSLAAQPSIEVMQFTGIRDEKEVPVYEGDIIDDEMHGVGVVKFDPGHFYVDLGCGAADYLHECPSFEVIGNIHENPELLTAETERE